MSHMCNNVLKPEATAVNFVYHSIKLSLQTAFDFAIDLSLRNLAFKTATCPQLLLKYN